MFRYKLQENTKIYLKSLLVEDDDPSKKKGSKKGKAKKEDAPVKTDDTPVDGGKPVSPVSDAVVVVDPAKTSLTPEEQKIKEAEQEAAEKKEFYNRSVETPDRDDTQYPFKDITAMTTGGPDSWRASGRGFGAPSPTEEPEDRTGAKESRDKFYNFDVLLGKSLPAVRETSDKPEMNPLAGAVIEPYKDLQRIKMARAYMPGILGKIQSVLDVETSGLGQEGKLAGGKKYIAPATWTGKWDTSKPPQQKTAVDVANEQITELLSSKFIPNQKDYINDLRQRAQTDPDVIDALYKITDKKIKRAEKGFPEASFQGAIQAHAEKLKGLGGLSPFFGEELAAKLLGGEWVEKAMQNIAPAQERGVISSMGNRSSIGM